MSRPIMRCVSVPASRKQQIWNDSFPNQFSGLCTFCHTSQMDALNFEPAGPMGRMSELTPVCLECAHSFPKIKTKIRMVQKDDSDSDYNPEEDKIERNTRSLSASQRRQVYLNQCGQVFQASCPVCDYNLITPFSFEVGHTVARACGGSNNLFNLQALCSTCNRSAGATHMKKYKKKHYTNTKKVARMRRTTGKRR